MKVHFYAACCQEEPILNYFFRYYDKFVTKYFLWYDHSEDNTLSILENRPNVKVFSFKDKKDGFWQEYDFLKESTVFPQPHDERKIGWVKNLAWKVEESLDCDWIICADIDEFIYHSNIVELLEKYIELGITVPRTLGYQMVNMGEMLGPQDEITKMKYGVEDARYSKNIIFNPKKVFVEYRDGCHFSSFVGHANIGDSVDLKLLHYDIFNIEYRLRKFEVYGPRLSEYNRRIHTRAYPGRDWLEAISGEHRKLAKIVI
jgi:hypothetical protein